MAELNTENLTSKVQSRVGHMTDRVSDIAQDVVGTIQANRPLMYLGIGLLTCGAAFGIFALYRQFGLPRLSSDNMTERSMYGSPNYRDSSSAV